MSYCKKCGNELENDAEFCTNCGTPVAKNIEKRKEFYDGSIHKCPNCGESLKSFEVKCPSCGCELRDSKSSNAVSEFAEKLEEIESKRETKKVSSKILNIVNIGEPLTRTDEQKISLIRSFPIPNTKEDLYEFLILSKSNVEIDLYENTQIKSARLAVSDAWKAKFEQAYHKAKLLFKNDEKMQEIQEMYDDTIKSIGRAKNKIWRVLGIIGIAYIVLLVFFMIMANGFSSNTENNSVKSEENIYKEVNDKQESSKPINNNIDEELIIKKIKVTEYKYIAYGKARTVLILNNESDYTLRINVDFKFYDNNGNLISAKNRSSNAVEKGQDTIMYVILDEDYDKLEYEISAEEDTYYKPIVKQLEYKSSKGKDKEVLTVTNNSDLTGQAIEGYAVFFNNNNVVCVDFEYYSDSNGVLKSKKSLTKEFNCDTSYDDVKFYFLGFGK